jgi:hypothetical protein
MAETVPLSQATVAALLGALVVLVVSAAARVNPALVGVTQLATALVAAVAVITLAAVRAPAGTFLWCGKLESGIWIKHL